MTSQVSDVTTPHTVSLKQTSVIMMGLTALTLLSVKHAIITLL